MCKRILLDNIRALVIASLHHEAFKDITAGIASIATTIALGVAGYWTYSRFIRTREAAPKVDLDVELSFVHLQGKNWIVEGVAVIKNPGTVRLDFKEFTYQLNYALSSDTFESVQRGDHGTRSHHFF